jgi:hypothetical protein
MLLAGESIGGGVSRALHAGRQMMKGAYYKQIYRHGFQ